MDHGHCLNCGHTLTGNYCVNCGQRATTHRFTLKHVFSHDLIHGLFHLDKGFLFTIKELLTRPGYSIREYIEGKRSQHFNYITFLLLMIAFSLFVQVSFGTNIANMVQPEAKDAVQYLMHLYQKYMKEMYMITIPLYALSTFIVFRSTKQNYAEHLVMNTYKEGGVLMISTVLTAIMLQIENKKLLMISSLLMSLIGFIYYYWFYRQYFKPENSNRFILILKICLAQLLALVLTGIVFIPVAIYILRKHLGH